MKIIENSLSKDINFLIDKKKFTSDKIDDLWSKRSSKISKNLKTKNFIKNIKNFRRDEFLISEEPRYEKNFLSNFNPYKLLHFHIVNKMYELLNYDEKKLIKSKLKFNNIGNPYYLKDLAVKYNKRWINHIHYNYLISKNIKNLYFDKKKIVCDIGGGYGISGYMLKKNSFKGIFILIEFPEQLITAKYFFLKNFKNIRINKLSDAYNNFKINKDLVKKYDVFLCPVDCFSKINLEFDLIINTFSLGEMKKKIFKNYINSKLFNQTKYIFLVNRVNSDIEYHNRISITDYNLKKFKKLHFQINQFNKYYVRRFLRYFGIIKKFNSEIFEFIGQNEKK
mgnify:CR=1 FL=1|tara:strand:- start:863 stop:1873 length:1011 start_codon:yes stop_codon:yes gene_type:complete